MPSTTLLIVIIVLLVMLCFSLLFLFLKKDTSLVSVDSKVKAKTEYYETLFNKMVYGLVIMDKDSEVNLINPSAVALLNLGETKGKDLNIFDIVGAFSRKDQLEVQIGEVLNTGEPRQIESVQLGEKSIRLLVVPIGPQNKPTGVGLILQDISQDKEIEKMRDDFTAMIVHELRSPLTVMSGTSDFLMRKSEELSKDQRLELLSQMKSSTTDLITMIDDLLDASKINSGKFQIQKRPNNINDLLQEEAKYFASVASDKGAKIKLDLNTAIGNANFDYSMVSHLVNNLITNALKYSEGTEIIVKSDADENNLIVSVSDNGKGLSDEDKQKMFQKYVRASTSENKKGTGLGLVIAKQIVSGHGGDIWIEDVKPSGAKFVFKIPRV